jgi:hypothetical protein
VNNWVIVLILKLIPSLSLPTRREVDQSLKMKYLSAKVLKKTQLSVANHGKSIIAEQTLYWHENQFPLTSRRVMNPHKKLERLPAPWRNCQWVCQGCALIWHSKGSSQVGLLIHRIRLPQFLFL